jgi:hypothetical protein
MGFLFSTRDARCCTRIYLFYIQIEIKYILNGLFYERFSLLRCSQCIDRFRETFTFTFKTSTVVLGM